MTPEREQLIRSEHSCRPARSTCDVCTLLDEVDRLRERTDYLRKREVYLLGELADANWDGPIGEVKQNDG